MNKENTELLAIADSIKVEDTTEHQPTVQKQDLFLNEFYFHRKIYSALRLKIEFGENNIRHFCLTNGNV